MPENFALYSRTYSTLPEDHMLKLAPGAQVDAGITERGMTYRYRWTDLTIICSVMESGELQEHLRGMAGYVSHIYGGELPERGDVLVGRVLQTKLVLGIEIQPERDAEGRAEELMGKLCAGLQPLIFYWNAIFDAQFRLLLGPDASFDPATTPDLMSTTQSRDSTLSPAVATAAQIARAGRSKVVLQKKAAPLFNGPLYVSDDHSVRLRDAAQVAQRVLVLWAVEQRAEGLDKSKAVTLLAHAGLLEHISPKETQFLQAIKPSADECRKFVWRLEAIWLLLWSLGCIETLEWPSDCCDIERLDARMGPLAADPDFVAHAALRPVAEILDAQDLTLRIHWAIRNEFLHQRPLPPHLDWSQPDRVEINECRAVGVVEQRHYALNWLTRFCDAEWDDVDTPT